MGSSTFALKQMLKQAAHTCKCKTPTFLLEEIVVECDHRSLLYTDETLVLILGADLNLETFFLFCFKQCQLFICAFISAKTLSDIINISLGR